MDLLKMSDYTTENGYDACNYGNLKVWKKLKACYDDVMGVKPSGGFCGRHSSLAADVVQPYQHRSYLWLPGIPCLWSQVEHRKFLCPAPAMTAISKSPEEFGLS